jgi:hypothetical protein
MYVGIEIIPPQFMVDNLEKVGSKLSWHNGEFIKRD